MPGGNPRSGIGATDAQPGTARSAALTLLPGVIVAGGSLNPPLVLPFTRNAWSEESSAMPRASPPPAFAAAASASWPSWVAVT